MTMSNAERQKKWRDKRNELARDAMRPPILADRDEASEFSDLMLNHWEAAVVSYMARFINNSHLKGKPEQIIAEARQNRPTALEMLEIMERAGEGWASDRFRQYTDVLMREAEIARVKADPIPEAKRSQKSTRRRT